MSPMSAAQGAGSASDVRQVSVLLYSDDSTVRDAVRLGVGRRPARDVEVATWRECATQPAVVAAVEATRFDVLILDGEAKRALSLLCDTVVTRSS